MVVVRNGRSVAQDNDHVEILIELEVVLSTPRAGMHPDIVERVLGHAIPGVEGVYDRHPFRDREGRGIGAPRGTEAPRLHARNFNPWTLSARGHSLVALPHVRDLLLSAKHLFVHGHWWRAPLPGVRMSDGTTLKSEDLASIPMAQGALPAWRSHASRAPACPWRPFLCVQD